MTHSLPLTLQHQIPARELVAVVLGKVSAFRHSVVLFDRGLEDLHCEFVAELTEAARRTGFLILLSGGRVVDESGFFEEVRSAVPYASKADSSLNVLDELLQGFGTSENGRLVSYWIWTNAHNLALRQLRFFANVLEALAVNARTVSEGFIGPRGVVRGRQQVAVIVTGEWEAMDRMASRTDSPLYRLSDSYRSAFPDLSTRFEALHVSSNHGHESQPVGG